MSHKKDFNEYRIEGDTVIIILNRRDGMRLETLIDLEDLEKVLNSGLHFHSRFNEHTQSYYAVATKYLGFNGYKRLQKIIHLHQIILDYDASVYVIDHINHDSLDNRKYNMIITDKTGNAFNRKSANKNSKSGERNVCLVNEKTRQLWRVQFQINGKNVIFANFPYDQLEEAKKYARMKRLEIYGRL